MSLSSEHKSLLNDTLKAIGTRNYYTPYPESPKAYPEDADAKGLSWFTSQMNHDFNELAQQSTSWIGEEISPYMQVGIGIKYPKTETEELINNAKAAAKTWGNTDLDSRADILIESLEQITKRYFDIAYATMHTTGQGYMMAFQASGPHSNDRALEAVVTGYAELTKVPSSASWVKPMGKFELKIDKKWKAIPKGISLVIGCSTFPIWNTVPGMYASLITGNTVIVKPHPKAVLPIAIVIAELQKVLVARGLPASIIQLAVDSSENPITKTLAENSQVKLVDYTGNSEFGNYIESLNKTVFTEKAGVNSVILDSVNDAGAVFQNLALSVNLYSGQMCTAPQNIFIPENGINTPSGPLSFDETITQLTNAITGLASHPKAGAPTLGAIQSDLTYQRSINAKNLGGKVLVDSVSIVNPDFKDARTAGPTVILLSREDGNIYNHECFGPIVFIIKTKNTEDSIQLAKSLASEKGALTCAAYCTDATLMHQIEEELNEVCVPVSFNFTGAALINSHAAFSDFHVTGGNAAGNASLTDSSFINRRFTWVGNRYA